MNKKIELKDLTLREKIGQTALMYPRCNTSDLSRTPYGGMWATGAIPFKSFNMDDEKTEEMITAESTKNKIRNFNKELKIPILPAMDSTSGITRAFHEMGFVADAVAVGSTDVETIAYEAGVARAKQLKAVGTGWLWWPEIDMANRNQTVMWGRLFSDKPDRAVALAKAAIKGCQDNGVAATAKHFPGADGIEYRDSHGSPGLLNITMEKWEETQGKMFQELIDEGVYSVMISHNAFPACDDTKINGHFAPSSVSYKVITKLLKEKMGFKGVVITDGINMKGLLDVFEADIAEVYIAAINAGNDVVLGAKDDYIDIIEKAVNDGRIPLERIDDACQRVLDMKEKLGMFSLGYNGFDENVEKANEYVSNHNKKVAENSLSLVVNRKNILPVNKESIKKVTFVVISYDQSHIESLSVMKEEFEKRGAEVFIKLNLSDHDEIKEIADNSDLIIYINYLMRGPNNYLQGNEKKTLSFVMYYGFEKSISIGMGVPFTYFDYFNSSHTYINTYNYYEETQKALVKAIYGEIPFKGGEPFKLIPEEYIYLKN